MKKLFNNRFLFILASSLIVLIILGVGAFYLFDDADDAFVKSGYVLNPLSSKVEKYFFDEKVSYKENLSSMIQFKDVDNQEVSILKDSFLHYFDNSLSFLKKGAILDLGSISGNGAVKFYNITPNSLVEKTNDGYIVKTAGDDIKFSNFIGRINDNKYIVVGDLNAKIPGNSTNVKGDYFEIVYVEEGIVNIENKNVKYQVAAEGTIIYVGNDIEIDLGDKKIVKNDEDVMSITAITINGDENIEIIPRAPEEDEDVSGGGGDGGSGSGDGNGTGDGDGDGNGDGTGDGNGTGTGGTGNPNVDVPKIEDIIITLKEAEIGSTNIVTYYDIINAEEDDTFMLKVTNLDTGRTLDMEPIQVVADYPVEVGMITPKTKYLFTIYNPETEDKYFQKIFETKDFGVVLTREYATSNAIKYNVTFGEDTEITGAKLVLYKYDEVTGENVKVETREYPTSEEEAVVIDKSKVILPNEDGTLEGEHIILFEGLESNSIYTAVLENIKIQSTNFVDLYNVSLTSLTLKKRPTFELMVPKTSVGDGKFTLTVGEVEDDDLAITGYTYEIYNKDEYNKYINGEVVKMPETVIKPETKKSADKYEVGIGEKGNNKGLLENGINYICRVVIEYFDNEKYMEYTTDETVELYIGDTPYIKVVRDDSPGARTYNKISADIYLTDNSCKIPMSGRGENCTGDSKVRVIVREVTAGGEINLNKEPVFDQEVTFKIDGNDIKYHLVVEGNDKLDEYTTYQIDVMAIYKDDIAAGHKLIEHDPDGDDKRITTKILAAFITDWKAKEWVTDHIVNIQTQFLPAADFSGSELDMTPEQTAAEINKVIVELYAGDYDDDLSLAGNPIDTAVIYNTETFNIKENFYDKGYTITTDGTFGIEGVDGLKALDPSPECKEDVEKCKLYSEYTVAVYAYYDIDGTDRVKLGENYYESYSINPILMQENIVDPLLDPVQITFDSRNDDHLKWFPALNELKYGSDAVIGYTVTGAVDAPTLYGIGYQLKTLTINVFTKDKKPVSFYVKDGDELKEVENYSYELPENWDGSIIDYIYMKEGIEYSYDGTTMYDDGFMRRGGDYYIGYVIDYDVVNPETGEVGGSGKYPSLETTDDMPFEEGYYKPRESNKVTPRYKEYIAYSDDSSITYRYEIKDVDGAIYRKSNDDKYSFYYTVQDTLGEIKTDEKAIEIADPTVSGYKTFAGYVTIPELSKNDVYKLYHKENVSKTGDFSRDVLNTDMYPGRIFDGYYGEEEYKDDFKFELINDDLVDNKVYIKILANEDILRRVISYNVLFVDTKGHDYSNKYSILTSCPGDEEVTEGEEDTSESYVARCIAVDYKTLEIRGMKSKGEENNYITVSVSAYYDNGIVGFEVPSYGDKYKYMVLQEYNSDTEYGKYISFANKKLKITDDKTERNYYNYIIDKNMSSIVVISDDGESKTFGVSWKDGELGVKEGSLSTVINPKMVAISDMKSDVNKFKFSSITPKVKVERKGSLINGAVFDITLTGADLNDFVKEKDGYYLYIDTFRTVQNAAGDDIGEIVRERLKYQIKQDKDGKVETIRATVDMLSNGREYYINVFANLYKNGMPEYVQLFDADNTLDTELKNYYFSPLGYNDIAKNKYKFKFSANMEKPYGSRDLTLDMKIEEYAVGKYNFDLAYAVYDYSVNCTPEMIETGACNTKPVVYGKIPKEELVSQIKHISDISDEVLDPDFEFGKTYYAFIYGIYEVWEKGKVRDEYLILNHYDRSFVAEDGLDKDGINKLLIQPKITVMREAKIITDEVSDVADIHVIEAGITVDDPHRTILNGQYFVKLYKGDELIQCNDTCKMQILDEEGNWQDVSDYLSYPLDAAKINTQIRFVGLTKDTKYKIYFEAQNYMNNIGLSESEKNEPITKEHFVYTANDLGIAIGEIRYRVEENSVIVSYVGGSSFKKIDMIDYKVQLNENASTSVPYSGSYILNQEGSKEFVMDDETGYFKFIIEDGLHTLGYDYLITTNYSILDGVDEEDKPKYKLIYSYTDTDLYQTTNKTK